MTTALRSIMSDRERRLLIDEMVIDNREAGIFRVHREAFTSQDILDAERRVIFGHCWLFLGHESEVAEPSSFVTRTVAGRRLIFARDRIGKLHAFYNTCSHRGAIICRERSGVRAAHNCPYHGWRYDDKGTLVGVPGKEGFSEHVFQNDSMNLKEVARLDSYCGFVFVCFDPGVMSLSDYLAGAKEVLELVSLHGEEGMEVCSGTQEYSISANWKLLFENSADGYHGAPTHITYFDYLTARDGRYQPEEKFAAEKSETIVGTSSIDFGYRYLGNGHSIIETQAAWGRPLARWVPGFGQEAKEEIAELGRRVIERLGQERGRFVNLVDQNCLIFPNFVVNNLMAITLRTFIPVRPNFMEVTAWALAPIGESKTSRERRLKNFIEFFGPAGFASPDDVIMLEYCQQGYDNSDVVTWNDISRGMPKSADKMASDDEEQMRNFWRRWRELMAQGELQERS